MTGAGGNESSGKSIPGGIPRFVELPLAMAGLIAAFPIILAAGVCIVLTSGRPVLFRQERVGRDGRRFRLWKLRTMRVSPGGSQVTARGDDRITPVGRILRKTKLDELPQLWNVLKGDMSLVGPRPEVPRYVDLEDPIWKQVLRSRPGITDPVTLKLRDEEALLARVSADPERYYREELQPAKLHEYVVYLETRSWKTDVEVLYKTVLALFSPVRSPGTDVLAGASREKRGPRPDGGGLDR
jgi:lipopolysaccharide/colanic/teichoic acid biosynthesis glycosyltransferase